MDRKTLLLASATLLLQVPGVAAEPLPLGWFGSLEGGWSFVSGGDTVYAINRSGYPDLKEESVDLNGGVEGRIKLGYRLSGGWDFALGVGVLLTRPSSDLTTAYGYAPPYGRPALSAGSPVVFEPDAYEYTVAKGTTDLTEVMIDFEAGYDVGIGGDTSLRLFGGLRAGFIDSDTDMLFGYSTGSSGGGLHSPYTLKNRRTSSFVGAGPRLGAEGEIQLGGGFGLFGGLSGSVLLGQLSVDDDVSAYGYSSSQNRSEFRAVYQLEGEIGLSYSFTEAGVLGALQVGYRGGQTWNAVDGSTGPDVIDPPLDNLSFGDSKENVTSHGPFVRLVFNF